MQPMFKTDWHIHTESSCDQACLPVDQLPGAARASGITALGITDHLHTLVNLPDIHRSYHNYLAVRDQDFHFGIELSVVSKWELDRINAGDYDPENPPVYGYRSDGPPSAEIDLGLDETQINKLQIEYVVAGAHWPMYVPIELDALIRDYHRQQMFLARDPRVDIIAHPWWWDNRKAIRGQQWAADFTLIPGSIHDEFIAAAKENNKLVEVNVDILLSDRYTEKYRLQYAEYLRFVCESGVRMTIGSDCHNSRYAFPQAEAQALLQPLGFCSEDFVVPDFRQVTHTRR